MHTFYRRLALAMFVVFCAMVARPSSCWADPPAKATADSSAADISAYRLGSGDRIRLLTFDESDLTGEFEVTGAGTVDLPLIGEIRATGLTTAEFGDAVEAALRRGFLVNPQVSVEVLNYRPFYILGEVAKPGEYPFTSGLTVLNAVATANGFTYRADTKHVYIKRAKDSSERRYDLTTSTVVAPGDTIRIGERYF